MIDREDLELFAWKQRGERRKFSIDRFSKNCIRIRIWGMLPNGQRAQIKTFARSVLGGGRKAMASYEALVEAQHPKPVKAI